MPRCARLKSTDSVYHIMVRSISDTPLFKCMADKDKYLSLVQKYQITFMFKVYAFCLMDTHAHFIIDSAGADISSIMHGINQSYAQYFNRSYNRHGHLFQDRFKSKIIYNEKYLITLSSYIHNNPADIKKYEGRIEIYKYSSLGIYLGLMNDAFEILDKEFILSHFSNNSRTARNLYNEYVHKFKADDLEDEDNEFDHEKSDYRSERRIIMRNITPGEVIDFVVSYTKLDKSIIKINNIKDVEETRSLSALLMRGLCGMKEKDICSVLGNITQSYASKLCLEGIKLISNNSEYKTIIMDLIQQKAC